MKLLSAAIPFRRSKEQPPAPGPGPVPPPAPEPAPPAPEPQPPTPDPTPPAPDLREWNVWELERLAGYGEARNEEVAFLLLELRQFANTDGRLPVSFDPVIRESFGKLLHVAV
jgi:hypothetical protein